MDNALASEVGSWRVDGPCNATAGTVNLSTLGQTIVREAKAAYTHNATHSFTQAGRTLGGASTSGSNSAVAFARSPSSKFFMMTASIQFPPSARGNASDVKAGFKILSSEHESTTIYYRTSSTTLHTHLSLEWTTS